MVSEKTFESPLDCKETKLVNPKVNQSWIFIGRTDAEAEAQILWPPDVKSGLFRKDPAGKDWRQEEKGMTEDKMVGWHHWLDGHEFEQAPGDGEGQGSLACCSPWGQKELDTTEQLNNSDMCLQWMEISLYVCVHACVVWCGIYKKTCSTMLKNTVNNLNLEKPSIFINNMIDNIWC